MKYDYFFFASRGGSSGGSIGPLSIDGRLFRSGADIWKGCGITAFRAYQLFITNEQSRLGDFIAWWTSVGGNMFRVFFTHGAPADNQFLPWNYPGYYDRLPEFFGWMASRGARVLATCLTGQNYNDGPGGNKPPDPEYMNPTDRERHVRAISRAAGRMHLVEGINENFKNGRIDIPADWFEGALWNLSCFNWDDLPPRGKWAAIHPERKDPANCVRKGHDIVEIPFDGPRGVTEWGQTLRDITTIDRNHTAGALTSLLGSFTIAHGAWETVQQCRIPTGDERAAFEAHARGFNSNVIPRDSASKSYRRDEASALEFVLGGPAVPENPDYGCQHLYAAGDDGHETNVIVEPSDTFNPPAKAGWKIVRRDESSVYLERA